MHLSPTIASCLTVAFIIFLFRRDIRERPDVSGALWLPLIWLLIGCSRSVSEWLNILGLPVSGAASVEEGSPLDASFSFALIIAGFCVLMKRQVRLSEIISNNGWLIAFLLYCFISIAWSDFPFVAFKRWLKVLGHPIMALIVLTEPNPEEAPGTNGIAADKNMLGADCLILGYFFFWYLLQTWRTERSTWRRNELRLIVGFLIGIWWLFSQAHSATSVTCLIVGVLIVLFVGIRSINKNFIGTYLLAALILLAAAEVTFGVSGHMSENLGRGSELSGRTLIWRNLLGLHTNPILGTGFESFWLGDRPLQLEGLFYYVPNEAHNGYLETYLTLGLVGVFLLVGLFVATFWKIRLDLFRNFEWGRYRLGFLAALVLYNWTEAAFRTLSPLWFAFYLIATDYPRILLAAAQSSVVDAGSEENQQFVYAEERYR